MVHIQDHSTAASVIHHWGYADRVVPCTNDAGSCEYLDAVYWMHDTSMLYTFIMWAVIGGILLLFITLRTLRPSPRHIARFSADEKDQAREPGSAYSRAWAGLQSTFRKCLLPESFVGLFGHVTRLQLLVLSILLAYLLIFTLVGIVYKTWITPVKKTNLFNTRTGLGGFSDRIGALAYALTPLTVALSTRESILTLVTGIPYQSLNFLHRWAGRIIFIQSFLHTLGWTLIEGKFYQPQPKVYREFIAQKYMVWGCVAMMLITFIYTFSLSRVIRLTGHEFFRKTHYVIAMIYVGACWGHWQQLSCWMIASLGIWGIDRGVRFLRTLLIHVGYVNGNRDFGFHSAQSSVEYFDDPDGGVVRLEFKHNHETWQVGQHFFLCFSALTIWQSHPLTVASAPELHPALPHHTYIVRCRKGETRRLKELALGQVSEPASKGGATLSSKTTSVILCGPYGTTLLPSHPNVGHEASNIIAVAGGTGISSTLPVALVAASSPAFIGIPLDFIWVIRRHSNMDWIKSELSELQRQSRSSELNLRIHIYITQESPPEVRSSQDSASKSLEDIEISHAPSSKACFSSSLSSSNPNYNITYMDSVHPSLATIVSGFLDTRACSEYRTRVIASGPAGMGQDLRAAVASVNDGSKVWKGDRRWDVSLDWDDRMG
ncbi:putative Ferric/cupric reductase transmembrane component 1 [Amylocarpus encephaloides]|uniref:Ferric/cupric reductase transmembrane component 1 n=1 Tax=Amylocarpus encephaloides TaxID=45428 RepID=A0A9P7YQX5_9HELO|nr:putative Ferric/cupric reductase transmembrane component 1 [Amylocarpus encephaloides]